MAILANKLLVEFTPVLGQFIIQCKSGSAVLQIKIHDDLDWVTAGVCRSSEAAVINNLVLGAKYRFVKPHSRAEVDTPLAIMTHSLSEVCGDCYHEPAFDPYPEPGPEPEPEPDPTDPTDPPEPTDPTDTPQPEPEPTDPTDPPEPTDPSEPTDSTDPTDPTDPPEPTDPTDPTQPVEPE